MFYQFICPTIFVAIEWKHAGPSIVDDILQLQCWLFPLSCFKKCFNDVQLKNVEICPIQANSRLLHLSLS